jgi:hypothetical protein
MTQEELKEAIKKLLSKPPKAESASTINQAVQFKKLAQKAQNAKSKKVMEQEFNNLRGFYK